MDWMEHDHAAEWEGVTSGASATSKAPGDDTRRDAQTIDANACYTWAWIGTRVGRS